MQVSFIIPLFNQLSLTQACLASLKATLPTNLTYEIILIDDGSTDATRDFLRELTSPYVVLLNERNLGYAASNNRAARVAQGEFLVLLNNDLVLESGWLQPMLEAFSHVPRVGVAGNLQLSVNTGEVDHAGVIFRDGGYPVHHRERVAAARARGAFAEFPAVTAACCCVRREWFLRTGAFDEGYRNGFEDTDLCLRAREDGFINIVATDSVVRHHISQSPTRGAFEFRNAERFLARWQPRAEALEKEWLLTEARRHAAVQAQKFFVPALHRVGFGPATLRRVHRRALAAERIAQHTATRPVRIGVDLRRMSAGGANGGVKPVVFSLLQEIGRQRGNRLNWAVFATPELRAELTPLLRVGDYLVEPGNEHLNVFRREAAGDGWQPSGTLPDNTETPKRAQLDALYAPLGFSSLIRPELPTVSFIVDVLHRDLPAALPVEEVNFRHEWFTQVARDAAYFHCDSRHVVARLVEHYGVHPARCFHAYNVVQHRLPEPDPKLAPPAGMPEEPFFFYPANFWPHKNHETLLLAYRLYAHAAGSRAWPLVFTGHPDARMTLLQEMRGGLGIADRVIFLGHLGDAAFSTLWSRAGALVFPSLHEGFGIPLLEAMRFGVPILAANTTSIPEVVGEAALLVDPRDPRALAEALRRIAIREGLREDLVNRGRARLATFSLELEASRVAHFLEAAARRTTP